MCSGSHPSHRLVPSIPCIIGQHHIGLLPCIHPFQVSSRLAACPSRLIEERAATNPLLVQQLGPPLHPGKWYNSSVGVSHGGFIGTATIAVAGSRHSSDVIITVRAGLQCKGPHRASHNGQ